MDNKIADNRFCLISNQNDEKLKQNQDRVKATKSWLIKRICQKRRLNESKRETRRVQAQTARSSLERLRCIASVSVINKISHEVARVFCD